MEVNADENKGNTTGEVKKGFAGMAPEQVKAIQEKARKTREENARKRNEAADLRAKAKKLQEKAETLRAQADEIDGGVTSKKARDRRKVEIRKDFEEIHGDSISEDFLAMLVDYAIKGNYTAEEVVTPTHKALDILNSRNSTTKEHFEAIKLIKDFENARAVKKPQEDAVVQNVEESMASLLGKVADAMPRSWYKDG